MGALRGDLGVSQSIEVHSGGVDALTRMLRRALGPAGVASPENCEAGANVLAEAQRHEVDALLGWYWPKLASGETPRELQSALDASTRRALRLTAELFEVLEALDQAGVEAMPFKGPALAWELYDSPALRPCCDLDVLIRRESVGKAIAAAEAAGYRSEFRTDARLYEPYRHYALERDGCILELHWGLMAGGHAYSGDPASLFRRARQVSVGGRTVRALAVEDLLPYLCLHAGKHRWELLKWVVDIERLLKLHSGSIDWERMWRAARRGGYRQALSVGLLLARDTLDRELPREAVAGLAVAADALKREIDWSRPATRAQCIGYQCASADWWRMIPVALSFLRPTPADAPDGRGHGYFAFSRGRARRALAFLRSFFGK
jgi:hypothetical protein